LWVEHRHFVARKVAKGLLNPHHEIDGKIVVTGGFRQNARKKEEEAYCRHWTLNTNIPLNEAK